MSARAQPELNRHQLKAITDRALEPWSDKQDALFATASSDASENAILNAEELKDYIQVNVTIDSSLDTEKLERQLALLRK